MVPLPHPGENPLATALTRVGDSMTAPVSSPGSPKSLRASQSCHDIAHAAPELRAVGAVVGAAKRGPVRALGTGARGGGGSYLPRRSRGSAWLRLLKLDYSPASRALLEYIPSSGGPGRLGGPRAAAERSVGPGHPAPLAVVSGCGRGAERKAAGPTRQPPGAAKGAGTCEGKARFASLRFLSNEMARGPVSLRHRPLTHWRGRGPLRARPAGEAKT